MEEESGSGRKKKEKVMVLEEEGKNRLDVVKRKTEKLENENERKKDGKKSLKKSENEEALDGKTPQRTVRSQKLSNVHVLESYVLNQSC